MQQVKIVTDSTSDLPEALLEEYGIRVIPLKVLFGDEVFKDKVDLDNKEFYQRLATVDKLPTTSQPSPAEFEEVYRELTDDGASVVSIHISSKMSGTSQAAALVAKNILPDRDITVIDSQQVCLALGLVVLEAARAARAGKTKEEVIAVAEMMRQKVHTYFVVDTLEYLQKGGRIGKATAFLGTMLNIKPILTIDGGYIAPFQKIRGKGKALEHIISLCSQFMKENQGKTIRGGLTHAGSHEDGLRFHERLKEEKLIFEDFIFSEVGAVVGTHCGGGTIALYFYEI